MTWMSMPRHPRVAPSKTSLPRLQRVRARVSLAAPSHAQFTRNLLPRAVPRAGIGAAAGLKLTLKGRRPSNDGAPPGVTAGCRISLQDVARNREVELLRRTRELELQLEVHRLAARNRELELQMMVLKNRDKMTQTTLRFTEADGARWCAPSVRFAPAEL